jgi:hypothetical protein
MRYLVATIIALSLFGSLSASAANPPAYWSEFDAAQRLSIGRFAARNGIDHAICLGTGAMRVTKYGERKFRFFDCRAGDDTFEHERQLTLRVTGPTTFMVTWLKEQVCTPKP